MRICSSSIRKLSDPAKELIRSLLVKWNFGIYLHCFIFTLLVNVTKILTLVKTTLIYQLQLWVNYRYESLAKIKESILWESVGYMKFIMKNIVYFSIIYKLCDTHLLKPKFKIDNVYTYILTFFWGPDLEYLPEHQG